VSTSPASGPIGGSTTVTVFGSVFVNTSLALVAFVDGSTARYEVAGTYATSSSLVCISPSVANPLNVSIEVALNGQQYSAVTSASFLFYSTSPVCVVSVCHLADSDVVDSPNMTVLTPASGFASGNTTVLISGIGFVDTGAIRVQFTGTEGVAVGNASFVSPTLVSLSTPAYPSLGQSAVTASIALNGQQFVSALPYLYYGTRVVFIFILLQRGARLCVTWNL
jgi:hypothetical protein